MLGIGQTTLRKIVLLILIIAEGSTMLSQIDTQQNMWVTWANETNQRTFCLSLASGSDPFRTCLFGVPIGAPKELVKLLGPYSTSLTLLNGSFSSNLSDGVVAALQHLNISLPWDPQELDLLGSVAVGNTSDNWTQTCFILNKGKQNKTHWTNITSRTLGFNANGNYCGWNNSNNSEPLGAYGVNDHNSMWPMSAPKALPPGIFLICGDRAWQGVPGNAYGGPCYIGRLTLFAPDLHDQRWSNLTAAIKHRRSENRRGKRELKKLGSDCVDDVELWGPAERFFAAALAPNVAVAHAMSNLNKLACWAVKQSNVTTQILSEMSQDMDSLRHAVLQNRAAIDFLLLAQGRGCEDFEGMCCFNLSDHGQSIHEQLKWLKDHTQRITVQYNWFDDLFRKMFGNVSTWILSLIKEGLRILFIIVLILIAVRVIFGCLTQKLEQLTKKVFLAQNKNGGIVEDWLEGRGHVKIEQIKEAELSAYRTQLM